MSFFGKSEPSLTRMAREISEKVAALDDARRPEAMKTIRYLVLAIRSLSNLTEEINETLFSVILTLVRKTMTGGNADKAFAELRAGLSAELLTAIEAESRA